MPTQAVSLYDLEQNLLAFTETAELVPKDAEQDFLAELGAAVSEAEAKRDRVAHFLAHLEQMSTFAQREMELLEARKAMFDRARARLEGYLIMVIESLGVDDDGRYRKLEGKTTTLSLRACPPSVAILDETLVPAEFKKVALKLPALVWEELIESVDLELREKVLSEAKNPDATISKTAVKAALDSGRDVPGADLIIGKNSLQRK